MHDDETNVGRREGASERIGANYFPERAATIILGERIGQAVKNGPVADDL
jgi:hypothetical protein